MDISSELITAGDKVLIAVSGGVDSVVLLDCLVQQREALDINLSVAHFDHQLRPTSGQDAEFVENLAKQYQLEYIFGTADVRRHSTEHKLSLEDAARKLRYNFLQKNAELNNSAKIATAHNRNDQVETIIMRFLRGSAAKGLSGMSWSRPLGSVELVRPFLGTSRDEIEAYAKEHKLKHRQDETNLDTDILRNKLRLEVIPSLKQINPNLEETVLRMAEILRADESELERQALETYQDVLLKQGESIKLDIRSLQLKPLAIQRRVVRQAIEALTGDLDTVSLAYIENFLGNQLNTLYLDPQRDLRSSKT